MSVLCSCTSKSTFYYDHLNGIWIQGPDTYLEFDATIGEGAGIVVDKITGEKNIIVLHVGGFTEILKIGTNKWTTGPFLMLDGHPLSAFLMNPLSVAMKGELFVFGGIIVETTPPFTVPNNIVYKMACENDKCLWKKTSVRLNQPYINTLALAFSVPNEVLNCK